MKVKCHVKNAGHIGRHMAFFLIAMCICAENSIYNAKC